MKSILSIRCTLSKFLVTALFALSVLLAGCPAGDEKPKVAAPVPVEVAVAVRKDVPVQVRAIGNVEAYSVVSVKSQVDGMLEEVHFREGTDVRKGQLLFTIDPRPFEAALTQARAVLARDIAQEKFAREEARRYGELLAEGIVTQNQYDQLRANADALAETVRADRAAVENARIRLGYCFIRSPMDGRTGDLAVRPGNLVRANDEPVLVTINRINPVYVTFSVPENKLPEIKRYMAAQELTVEASVRGDTGPAERGVLSFLDNMVDTATGTFMVKGTFANGERRLWPGQFADVTVTLTTLPDAVVVPSRAIQTGQEGLYVFAVKPDLTVASRPVSTGEDLDGETVVIKGLNPGETVITDGHLNLVPGARVEIKNQPAKGKAPRP